jgi:hypothetical protein
MDIGADGLVNSCQPTRDHYFLPPWSFGVSLIIKSNYVDKIQVINIKNPRFRMELHFDRLQGVRFAKENLSLSGGKTPLSVGSKNRLGTSSRV